MPPLGPGEQARILARKQLDTNNAVNHTSNAIISIFEGWEGSLEIRDYIDHALRAYALNKWLDIKWDVLRKLMSIKEKIAHMTWIEYEDRIKAWDPLVDQAEVDNCISEIINNINDKLFATLDFSESWILRHSAYNVFEPKYTPKERLNIEKLAQKIKKIASDARARGIVEAMDSNQESDPQKVIKLEEVVMKLTKAWVNIDDETLTLLEWLSEKIEPLKALDKSYKRLSRMQTTVHTLGKSVAQSMISESKKGKLFAILQEMGKSPQDFVVTGSDLVVLKNNLSDLLHDRNRDSLNKVLGKYTVSRKEFEQRFLSYYAYASIGAAKEELVSAKQKAFWHKLPAYENWINKRRWSARERVLALHPHMIPAIYGLDFGTDQDYELVNNYFTSFRSVFYADPEADRPAFDNMREIVSAIIRRRVPAVAGTQKLRPVMSKVLKAMWAKIGKSWWWIYHDAKDDAEIFATIVMMQAQTSQEMYYNDKDQTIKPENFTQRISKRVSRTEVGRQWVKKIVKPWLKWLLRIWENATRYALTGVWSAVAWTAKTIAWTDKNAEGNAKGGLARMNRWTEKSFHWAKLPFYALWPATYVLEKWFTLTNHATIWLMVWWTKLRKSWIESLKTWTHDENVTHLVDSIGKSLDTATSWISKPISWIGEKVNEQSTKIEQRKFLAAFYEAAAAEDNLSHIMETTELANMISLKDFWPYLFDEDGRITPADIEIEVEKEWTPDNALEALKKTLDSQVKKIEEGMGAQRTAMSEKVRTISAWDDIQKTENVLWRQQALLDSQVHVRTLISKVRACITAVWWTFTLASKTAINGLITEIANVQKTLVDDMEIRTASITTANGRINASDTTINVQTALIAEAARRRSTDTSAETRLNTAKADKQQAQQEKRQAQLELQELRKTTAYISCVKSEIDSIKAITDVVPLDLWGVVNANAKALMDMLKRLDLSITP